MDLEKTEIWVKKKTLINFSREMCKALLHQRYNSMHQHSLWHDQLNTSNKKGPGVTAEIRLIWVNSGVSSLVRQTHTGLPWKKHGQQEGFILSAWHHGGCCKCVLSWVPWFNKVVGLKEGLAESYQDSQRYLTCAEGLRGLRDYGREALLMAACNYWRAG